MKKAFYILIFLILEITHAQVKDNTKCNLQAENKLWKSEFENNISEIKHIELIKNKIRFDSIYKQSKPNIQSNRSLTIKNENQNLNGIECGCKILFVLNIKKKRAVILNLNEKPELSSLINKLNEKNTELIRYEFDEKKAQSIWGPAGKCGFVTFKITDKKLNRDFKKVW